MKRAEETELLDVLAAGDPRARQSRRDLRRVNFWMGHPVITAHAMRGKCPTPPRRIIELGAGDGTFLLTVLKRLGWSDVGVTLIDRQQIISPATMEAFASLGSRPEVIVGDVFDCLPAGDAGAVVLANLFLHHFNGDQLPRLLEKIAAQAALFVALEPRRARPFLSVAMLRLIGCNGVTCHDAAISIRAGFRGEEISASWPDRPRWRLTERDAGLFSHLFVAERIS